MAERKSFLLRIDGGVLDAVRHWADDDLRSLNGQIEFLLRRALRDRGRLKQDSGPIQHSGDDPLPPAPTPDTPDSP